MYDWANSAFATTVLAAVLPFYYSDVAGSTLRSPAVATQYWSATLAISIFIVAVLSPILGTISDIKRRKKRFLSVFITIGVIGTGLLVLVNTGDWLLASILFLVGRVGFAGANVFYDALLPHVARDEDQDRVSAQGYALGYLGGGILLAVNVAMIQMLPNDNWGVRLSMLSVAVWWAVFSIPLFRRVPEPPAATQELKAGDSLFRVSFARVIDTLGNVRQYRELFKFLVAFLIYNDGIGIIITIAAIYAAELGFGLVESVLAFLLVQFVGIPYSLIFGNLPSRSDRRQTRFTAFVVFNIVALPLVGISGRFLLPQELTGRPSPPFVATASAAGEGSYSVEEAGVVLVGDWSREVVSAAARGADEPATYATTAETGARLNFAYNGQPLEIVYSSGPDRGIYAVEIDGAPLVDDDAVPITLNGHNPAVRYDESVTFTADDEGEHVFSLVNTGQKDPASSGTVLAVSQVEVLPPLRVSNLGTILLILLAVEAVGVLFAFLLGPPLFSGLAASLDTKRSIMLALVAYSIISVWGFFLNTLIEFWFLAWMVGVVQGGSQALSRSLYAAMSPAAMSGEFFGLFSIMSKFASFFSPLVFTIAVFFFDSSRPGILAIIAFFLVGMLILRQVDVDEGKRVAREKDRELLAGAAGAKA
jgi:UMF1 family MFS transporter